MRRSFLLLFAVAGSVLAFDQWSKRWATDTLAYREPMRVIGDVVRFTYTRNSGVAFGLGAGLPFPYAVFSIVAVAVILWLFLRQGTHTLPRQLSLSLILGGALGNLVDRLTTREVVDFILIGWRQWYWPVFNVADTAVTAGVVLFGLTWASHTEERAHLGDDAAATPLAADAHATSSRPDDADVGSAGGSHVGSHGGSHGGSHDLASAVGGAAEHRGAARPLPGAGADRPLA